MKGVKIRLSRTLVMVLGGCLLIGVSGAAALYVGADRLLGPSYEEVNGLECTTLQVVKIKRENYYWVRKYVFTEGGDGPGRLKTALRVAKTVQAAEHADLVQVTILDKSGPTQRAAMRGRAIGAQVVYMPDPSKAPEEGEPRYAAFYIEGASSGNGEFYGLRIEPPLEDIEHLSTSLTDTADCVSPVVEDAAGHGAATDKHGDKPSGHGETPAKSDGHGAPDGHGKSGEHGAEPAQGAKPDAHGEGAAAPGEHGPEAEAESGGLISSLKGMIFGGSAEAKTETAQHDTGAAAHTADAGAPGNASPSPEHTAVTEDPGLFAKVKAMVFGDDKPGVVVGQGAQPIPATAQEHGEAPAKPQDGIDPMKVAAPTKAPSH